MSRDAAERVEARWLSRRRIIASAGLAVACTWIGRAASAKPGDDGPSPTLTVSPAVIRARPGKVNLRGTNASPSEVWGYDGAAPGPTLRVKQGREVTIRLVNDLPEPTCVHWHGVHLPNAMDGIPGLTQAPIAAGASFDYRFTPPDAGTFWYHPPADFAGQLGRGLAGALVVEEAATVDVDRDVALVLSDWRLAEDGAIEAGEARAARHLTANGAPTFDLPVAVNERLRLRLINASAARPLAVRVDRHQPVVMAVDGEPAEPFATKRGRTALGPGNRLDLFIDATLSAGETAPILAETAGGEQPVARLVYVAAPGRATQRPEPAPLPDNPLPRRIDLTRAFKLEVPVQAGEAPADNSRPLFSIKRGRAALLGFANRTDGPMTLHVHGHHFRLLDRLDDGWKAFWLDTLLIEAGQTDHIVFVADNPGKWRLDVRPLASAGAQLRWFEVL